VAWAVLAFVAGDLPAAEELEKPGEQKEKPPGVERHVFGTPPGTRSEYEVTTRAALGERPLAENLAVTVYRPAGEGAKTAALILRSKGDREPASTSPVIVLTLDEAGRPKRPRLLEFQTFSGQMLPGAFFFSSEGPALAPGARWTAAGAAVLGVDSQELELEHAVKEENAAPTLLRLESRLPAPAGTGSIIPRYRVASWRREVTFVRRSGRPRSIKIECELEMEGYPESQRKQTFSLEAREVEHAELGEAASAGLREEIERLDKVMEVAAAHLGGSRKGLLARLLGGRKKPEGDPLELIDGYLEAYPRGLLVSATQPLRQAIAWQLDARAGEKEREAVAQALLGKPAPDFTLKDLDGKEVSLRDFRGKVVLLSFWGYG
jgi:hypothetical protein